MARNSSPIHSSRLVLSAAICIVFAALYFAQDVLIPLAFAILLSFLLAPAASRLERWRLGRIPSVLIVAFLSFVLIGVLGYVAYAQMGFLVERLPSYRENIQSKVQALQTRFGNNRLVRVISSDEPILPATMPATTLAATAPPIQTVRLAESRISTMASFSGRLVALLAPLGTAAIVVVFTLFILFQRENLRGRLLRLSGGRLITTTQALDDAGRRISRFLSALAVINGTYGLAIVLGLLAVGWIFAGEVFPNVVLWGLLCALFRFIPYVGPWLGATPPLALALAAFPGPNMFFAAAVMFIAVELFVNGLLEPWIYGSRTGVSSMAVLVAAVFWTSLWGIPGLFLSTPLTVCLAVLGRHVRRLKFLDILLGDTPALSSSERFYQRLLAMDKQEAGELVRQELTSHSLEEVYHGTIIPALEMAEQDGHRGDLDEEHQNFIHQTLRVLIDDLGKSHALPSPVAPETNDAKSGHGARTPYILCLPAHDEGDELAGMMFAQVLAKSGYRSQAASFNALASEMVQKVELESPDVICISALPPSAVVHSRYLCKRLSARFPNLKTIVGLWTSQIDARHFEARLGIDRKDIWVATGFLEAVEKLRQIVQPTAATRTPT